jgi:hypothetical protein
LLTDAIDVAVEVRLEEFEHPAERHSPFRGVIPEDDRDLRIAEARAVAGAGVGKDNFQMIPFRRYLSDDTFQTIHLAISNAVDDSPD